MKHSQDQWSSDKLKEFWDGVFDSTREMAEISSTRYFAKREKTIIAEWFGNIKGKKILKSDLWDEIKNTKLMLWAHNKGAECYGIDISQKVINEIKKEAPYIKAVNADVRDIPYKDNTFDYVISIGTVEHFPDTIIALKEMRRVLKVGGVAMVSVPVKYDIWGRFILIWFLQLIGIYKYGYEIQYKRSTLKSMLEEVGFEIEDERGYLIYPSSLRILDYAFHEKNIKLGNYLIDKILGLFYKIELSYPSISRWGYMVAFRCVK